MTNPLPCPSVCTHLVVQLCPTLCDLMHRIAPQASLSMEFSRQESWRELPFPTPGDLPDPGIKLASSWQAGSLLLHRLGSPLATWSLLLKEFSIVIFLFSEESSLQCFLYELFSEGRKERLHANRGPFVSLPPSNPADILARPQPGAGVDDTLLGET